MAKKRPRRRNEPLEPPPTPDSIHAPLDYRYLIEGEIPEDTSAMTWRSLLMSNYLDAKQAQLYGFYRQSQDDPRYHGMLAEYDMADAFGGDATRGIRARNKDLRRAGAVHQVGVKRNPHTGKPQRAYRTTGGILSPEDRPPPPRQAKTVMLELREDLIAMHSRADRQPRIQSHLLQRILTIDEWLDALDRGLLPDSRRTPTPEA
jgi:hypothetical protein